MLHISNDHYLVMVFIIKLRKSKVIVDVTLII